MPLTGYGLDAPPVMVKHSLADTLRTEMMAGRLKPGEALVEGRWARRLGVAQASIREALHILAAEGFVQKVPGRTATVTVLTETDVRQIYELRAVLEGFAAQLAAQRRIDLNELEQVVADMRAAAECGNLELFYRRDMRFHLLLAQKSGNRFLHQDLQRLVAPLFAFVLLRGAISRENPDRWATSVREHQEIVEAIRTGDPVVAARTVSGIIRAFSDETMAFLPFRDPS